MPADASFPPAWIILAVVASAAALSAGLIRAMLPTLQRHAMAQPNARSSHRTPTPQGGGAAVVAAMVAVSLAAAAMAPGGATLLGILMPVMIATVLVALVGAIDDVRGLSVAARLALQAAAVALVIATLPPEARVTPALPMWLERALLVLGGVYFVNIVNFMDGIDWITVTEVVPLAGGLSVLGLIGALPAAGTLVALALLGGMLGFAPFNRPVARLFLGDVGSLPVGLVLGWLLLLLAVGGHWAAAFLLPLYYLADASVTLARRAAAGEAVWQAHRTHFYQRATDRGFTVLAIDARIFAVNLVLVALAVTTVVAAHPAVDTAAVGAGVALVAGLLVVFARGRAGGAAAG